MSSRNHVAARRSRVRVRYALFAVLALAIIAGQLFKLAGVPIVFANNTAQTIPFSQDWSNTGLITVNDDWTGVPGIEGFLGQDITTATGTDPQTLLGTSALTGDLTVLANQTATSITNGDVAEFHTTSQAGAPGTNPTIALQGSGAADAPYVLIHLNTGGTTAINISYNLRDIDCTADNAAQPVALQYRVGSSGNFTNVSAGYVADATAGPSLCTLVTPVSVALPVAVENQALVQLRIMTTNAVGSDEWVGIDDISITGTTGGPPTLSINDVSQVETNAGTTNFTFTVSLTAPAGPGGVAFNWDTADGTAQDDNPGTDDNDYVPVVNGAGTIAAGNTSTTVTVQVNGDTTGEPNETFFVNLSNIPAGVNAGDVQGQGTIINDDAAAIHTVQGSGTSSPFTGSPVTTTGIVTLLKTTTNNGGPASHFFMQTPDADVDADPNTSQGVLVFTSSVPTVAVGDEVSVTGTVEEFFGMTRITSVTTVSVIDTGNPLPTPVTLTTTILDPSPSAAGQPQLEKYEAMRLSAASLTSVAPNDDFFDVDTVITGVPRPFREPGIEIRLPVPPDPTSGVPDPNVPRWDENPERIVIDTNARAGGSLINYTTNVVFSGVVGPLDFTFGRYRLVIESDPQATANISAVPLPVPLATEFTVGNLNIIFFANGATQKTKASLAIRNIMRSPDIIGHQEINNLASLQALATQINNDTVAAGGSNPMYTAHLIPATAAGAQNVGFLVKSTRVQVNSVTQEELPGCVGTTATCYTYTNPVNGQLDVLNDRPPLVLRGVVDPSGSNPIAVIAIVNHTRSFIDIDHPVDGPRVRAKRKAQSEFLASLLQNLQTNNPATSIISVGDYNAYQFNDGYTDPIATIIGNPTPDDQVVVDQSPDLVNPNFFNLMERVPATERYSFIFEGTPQDIDHIIVNRNASARTTRVAVAHMDADFPASYASDITRPERSTDHDAPVAYFNLTLAPTAAEGTVTGTIADAGGLPIAGAVVNLTGTQNRKTITDANGQYRFDGVETSGFYVVKPSRANYSFSPAEKSFTQIGNQTEAAFTGSVVGSSADPLDTPEYFVRQHYLDFLGREPDEAGFNFWSDQILACGADTGCVERRTINVSAAYFLSIEFQQTGGLVDGLYRASFGRAPKYAEFVPDRTAIAGNLVVGKGDWERELATNKQAFADAFVNRPAFQAAFAGASDTGYVDALIANTRVSFGESEREALVNGLGTGALTRAAVLLRIAEHEGFVDAKRNEAFVMMQYFGYLRRDPDENGYDFWLGKLNRFNGNFEQAEMVKAFISSTEYRARFR